MNIERLDARDHKLPALRLDLSRKPHSFCAFLFALLFACSEANSDEFTERPLVGYLSSHTAWVGHYKQALAEVGFVDGKNFTFVWRGGDQKLGELPKLARDLVDLHVRLILVDSTLTALAAKEATSSIPIVISHVGDPVGFKLVSSLAHPGGNITGVTLMTVEITAKRMEVLKETVPKRSRVVVLWNPTNPIGKVQVEDAEIAANRLGLKIQRIAVRRPEELTGAFLQIANSSQTGILFTDDTMVWNQLNRVAGLSLKHSVPGIGGTRLFPESGVLLSYGPNPKEQYQRAALYVDKILKGARPADLPVEQPTKFELVVNLKTAKALGIPIPESILLRAEEVIR